MMYLAVLDALFPETCAFCGAGRDGRAWLDEGPLVNGLRAWDVSHCCGHCYGRLSGRHWLGEVAGKPLRSPLTTTAGLTEVIGRYKYQGIRGLAWPLAHLQGAVARTMFDELGPALLVPVPLHRGRRRERGFDQVLILAHLVATQVGTPCVEDILVRRRSTRQQARLATAGHARDENVAGAFRARPPAPGERSEVILLEDLVTTGATLAAAAAAMTAAGWQLRGSLAVGQARRLLTTGGGS